jgi:Rad3-related DNA helicase
MTVLSPWNFLKSNFWNKLESIILTSATLQMQDDFAYIHRTLQTHWFQTEYLESDFDYTKQALVCIPNDLWSVKNNAEQIVIFLWTFFRIVQGNTLVLFTAFAMIRSVFSALKIDLQREWISLLAQSISGSKHKQIESFKKHSHNSILLGTDSFWEWIDIPWEDLQYLVIHKIPFPVPSDPIFMARSKLYSNSFEQYAVPKSILKLKQGFGRLIRTKKDSWIVLFLDDRIYTTRWGEKFLSAFPSDIKVRYASSEKILSIFDRNKYKDL